MQNAVEKDGKSAVLNKSTVVTRSALQDKVKDEGPLYSFTLFKFSDTAAERKILNPYPISYGDTHVPHVPHVRLRVRPGASTLKSRSQRGKSVKNKRNVSPTRIGLRHSTSTARFW